MPDLAAVIEQAKVAAAVRRWARLLGSGADDENAAADAARAHEVADRLADRLAAMEAEWLRVR